jgi:hypothetical protein
MPTKQTTHEQRHPVDAGFKRPQNGTVEKRTVYSPVPLQIGTTEVPQTFAIDIELHERI